MDEALGGLIVIGIVISVVVAVVTAIVTALGQAYAGLSVFLGHPLIVTTVFAAVGAIAGVLRHQGRSEYKPTLESDYAEIGGLSYLPAQWAIGVALTVAFVVAAYGVILL